MIEAKLKILAIGEDCKQDLCSRELFQNNLGKAPITVDCVDSFEKAFQHLDDLAYDYYLVCSKNTDREKLNKLKEANLVGRKDNGFYDQQTGLCSRIHFLNKIKKLDLEQEFPLSFILGDLNDLKLINDLFGYSKGDSVIREVAGIFKKHCCQDGLAARWNGDEFAIALPETNSSSSYKIQDIIRNECKKVEAVPLEINLALGTATKKNDAEDVLETLKIAEAEMRQNKLKEAKSVRNATIASLVKCLGEKNYETEEHVWRMQTLAVQFGLELRLPDSQLEDLILTVTLHDIGKLAVPEHILMKTRGLTPKEWKVLKGHSEKGYRIALSSGKFSHIAPAILAHHERWDGKGYPLGLKGEKIPLLSRIVAIVDSYDVMTNGRPYKKALSKEEALQELRRSAGTQFDPELVEIFSNLGL